MLENFIYIGGDELDAYKISTYKINAARKLRYQMEEEVEKYKKLTELAYDNEIAEVKRNVGYLYLIPGVEQVKKWLTILKSGTKINKKQEREGKEFYNFLLKRLNELLGVEVKEIEKINIFSFECLAYIIYFKIDGVKESFELWIPLIEKINRENYETLNFGKLHLNFDENEYSSKLIGSSYEIKEIEVKFKKWLEENTNIINNGK